MGGIVHRVSPVRADIYTLGGLSAHASQAVFMGWLGHFHKSPRKTLVVHGAEKTALGFGALIQSAGGGVAQAPLEFAQAWR